MDNELQHVSRRLAGLAAKRPGLALGVWGEPGIGKTHTALALLRGAPCQSFTVHATQALEGLINAIPRPKRISVWLERSLERLGRGELQGAAALNQTLAALLAANAPIILHVEDLHEASEERLEFWVQLAPIIARTRGVGFIVTSRTQPPDGFEAIRLSALNREASKALLEAEAGATLPSEALDWVFEKAAGNPLYTLEFFRFLARQGFLWNDGKRWRWRVPEREVMPVTVEALIERMLRDATSTPALENAVQAKAVLGLGATETLWAEVAGSTPENLLESKRELERQGVLFDNEFAHPLYREVVANGLTPEQRQIFARRALKTLETHPQSAAEFVKDARLEPPEALEKLQLAAMAAIAAGDKIQSFRFKAKAVEYAMGEEKIILALEAAQGFRSVNLSESARLANIVLDIQPDNKKAILIQADLLARQGRLDDVQRMLNRLPENERTGDVWLIHLLRYRWAQGDYVGVLKMCQEKTELLETTNPDLCSKIAGALSECGENTRAWIIAQRGLAQPELIPHQRAELTNVCGLVRYNQGDYLGAEAMFTQALSLNQQIGSLYSIAAVHFNRSSVRKFLGLYREMTADLMEALRLCLELGDRKRYAHAQTFLAAALIPFAEYEQAEELLLESRKTLEQLGVSSYLIDCENQLGVLYGTWYSPHSKVLTLKYAHTALEYARNLGNPALLVETIFFAAQAQISNGNGLAGMELTKEMFELLAMIDTSPNRSRAYFVRAKAHEILGQFDEALDALHRALELVVDPLNVQTILLEIDRITHNLDGALVRLAWFAERGLQNGVNIAHRYFPELALKNTQSSNMIKTSFRLEVLGSMQLRQEGVITPLRGGKRRELLAVLLEARIRGRTEVSSLELCDALYPLEPEDVALGALKATVHKIRQSLGSDLIATTPNGYALGAVTSDAEDFLRTSDANLWRGLYLEDAALEGRDENVREALHHALEMQAKALLETDPQEAVRLGRILISAEPYDVSALEITCRALQASKNHRGVLRLYEEARARLLEVGETLPERWADFVEAQTV